MFTKLYLQTTDPTITLSEMLRKNMFFIIISTLFHTIVYTLFFNLANFIFFGKYLPVNINTRLITSFIIIMFFGYIARYYHVKEIYNAYNKNAEKTRNHLDKLYIGWIFVG